MNTFNSHTLTKYREINREWRPFEVGVMNTKAKYNYLKYNLPETLIFTVPTPYLVASRGVKGMNSNVNKTSSRPTQRQAGGGGGRGGGGGAGGIAGLKRGVREMWLRRVRPDHAFQGGGRVRPGEDGVRQGGDRLSRVGVG